MLIILDRDGVINEDSDEFIKSPEEWHALPGSLAAIARLNHAGHKVVIATNQSGIGRGYFTLETLQQIHQKMADQLTLLKGHIDRIYYCPHAPEDGCECRKPKPGLLQQIAAEYKTDFHDAIIIGDSWRDIQPAQAVHCKAVLVRTGKGVNEIIKYPELKNIPVFNDLAAAVEMLLGYGLEF